jgi:hypothetical protein
MLSPDRNFPSEAKLMDGSENPESISSSREVRIHSSELTVCLSGVSGESTVDDESQLDPSDEIEEFIDELDEKGDATEWLLSPNRMFSSPNMFIMASVEQKSR